MTVHVGTIAHFLSTSPEKCTQVSVRANTILVVALPSFCLSLRVPHNRITLVRECQQTVSPSQKAKVSRHYSGNPGETKQYYVQKKKTFLSYLWMILVAF